MSGRETTRPGVVVKVFQTDGARIVDEGAEQAVTLREMSDYCCQLRSDADMNELLKPAAGGNHTQRTILRADQFHRSLNDPFEHDGQFEVLYNGEICSEQRPQPPLRGEHVLGTVDEVTDRAIQLGSWFIGKSERFVVRCHVTPLPTLIQ